VRGWEVYAGGEKNGQEREFIRWREGRGQKAEKRYKWHVVEKILTNIFLSSSPPQNKTS